MTFSVPQIFFYNINMLPSELFDESISLRVRTDTLNAIFIEKIKGDDVLLTSASVET